MRPFVCDTSHKGEEVACARVQKEDFHPELVTKLSALAPPISPFHVDIRSRLIRRPDVDRHPSFTAAAITVNPQMGILRYVEWALGTLLYRVRGHDAKLITRTPLVAATPQNLTITSSDAGDSGAHLGFDHTQFGANKFPCLAWKVNPDAELDVRSVQEYVLIVEDADAPLPMAPNHGMFYALPADKTHVAPEDFERDSAAKATNGATYLKGGFRLGKNLRGTVYGGPRPALGHGEHRYFFQVIALKEKLDAASMSPIATRDELLGQMEGKIAGWGAWIGVYEQKW